MAVQPFFYIAETVKIIVPFYGVAPYQVGVFLCIDAVDYGKYLKDVSHKQKKAGGREER